MQTQLFISGALAALTFAPMALACGPDNPDQVSRPQFSVTLGEEHNQLTLHGPTAKTIFDLLTDPKVRRFDSNFYQIKKGFGILCVWQSALQNSRCWQKLTDDGEVKNFFPFTDSLNKSNSRIRLTLKGSEMEQLYNRMSESGDIIEYEDGSLGFEKQRTGLTCTKLFSPEGAITFDCSQVISDAGLPTSPGTDPMIGSGTRPVTLEVTEGVN